MAISKRAKIRFKMMTASEKSQVRKAAKTLFDYELIGSKRAQEITRWSHKR